jgi:predicted RNA binding protein YcfA (HicA-like mRNA interferase family)
LVEITAGILGLAGGERLRAPPRHRLFRHADLPAVITVAGKPNTTVPPGILSSIRRFSGLEALR